ncbi:MAG: dTDP-4-dehydrorhamnose 3,5-epimerase [Chloroflexi bacterium]|nr:dTDP-4-dehydrorhamnose 3,5-epimerase [Chloroflexota bacterium]
MRFQETKIAGVVLITPDRFDDERGYFARTWGLDDFEAQGLTTRVVSRNVSYNRENGTLRGMHFQHPPYSEVKVVACLIGSVFDVAVDLRPDSPTFGEWYGAELTQGNGAILYVPEGCAHGYLSLVADSTVEYLISEFYHPEAAGGLRWDDPFCKIQWPAEPKFMNDRDRTWPDFIPDEVAGLTQT